MYLQNMRRISVAVTSSNTKSNMRKAPFPARRMTPNKSEACQAKIELLLEYDRTLEIVMGLWGGNGKK